MGRLAHSPVPTLMTRICSPPWSVPALQASALSASVLSPSPPDPSPSVAPPAQARMLAGTRPVKVAPPQEPALPLWVPEDEALEAATRPRVRPWPASCAAAGRHPRLLTSQSAARLPPTPDRLARNKGPCPSACWSVAGRRARALTAWAVSSPPPPAPPESCWSLPRPKSHRPRPDTAWARTAAGVLVPRAELPVHELHAGPRRERLGLSSRRRTTRRCASPADLC